jgi:dipeptide/tripeptide permease
VPILGAVIADTYWGNYKTVLISFIVYLLVRSQSSFSPH